jgi:hypothetical protein
MALKTNTLTPSNIPSDTTEITDAQMLALAEELNAIEPGAGQAAYEVIRIDFYALMDVLAVLSIWGFITAIIVLSLPFLGSMARYLLRQSLKTHFKRV